jgi:YesN/AraC family two-component response regulator
MLSGIMTQYSILIIDDEANQRLMLEQALRSFDANWRIATAANGSEALELAASQPPDLIITDYNMPGMNGLDVIAQVRNRGMVARIILMTAYSSAEISEAAERLQVDHYLTKPVPVAQLRRLAADSLQNAPSQADTPHS